jgi:hypothetical protein
MDVAHVSSLGLVFAKNPNLHHEFLPNLFPTQERESLHFNEMPFGFSAALLEP